ncbi:hypothetical protein ACFL2J_07190 [Candidatus Omnitrophota bacterium]
MIAGVPGIGISGLFYLLSAFFMPFFELSATLRGRSSFKRWKLVTMHHFYFWGIILGSYAIIVLFEIALKHYFGIAIFPYKVDGQIPNILSIVPVVVTLSLLLTVLITARLIRIVGALISSLCASNKKYRYKR